jgi:hypothetical protein
MPCTHTRHGTSHTHAPPATRACGSAGQRRPLPRGRHAPDEHHARLVAVRGPGSGQAHALAAAQPLAPVGCVCAAWQDAGRGGACVGRPVCRLQPTHVLASWMRRADTHTAQAHTSTHMHTPAHLAANWHSSTPLLVTTTASVSGASVKKNARISPRPWCVLCTQHVPAPRQQQHAPRAGWGAAGACTRRRVCLCAGLGAAPAAPALRQMRATHPHPHPHPHTHTHTHTHSQAGSVRSGRTHLRRGPPAPAAWARAAAPAAGCPARGAAQARAGPPARTRTCVCVCVMSGLVASQPRGATARRHARPSTPPTTKQPPT